jgi:SAM-dependent methyltransferase
VFRVAVSGRREQEPSFFTVIVWRDQAEHASESLSKGSRVMDAERLGLRAGWFDVVCCASAIYLLADQAAAVRGWGELLRPGGLGVRRPGRALGLEGRAAGPLGATVGAAWRWTSWSPGAGELVAVGRWEHGPGAG